MHHLSLINAQRPAILVGGGAYKAREAIERFAITYGIPVFRTWNGLDIITDDSPVYAGTVGTYGGPGRNFGIQNCDWLLSLGCRMSGRITGGLPETFARGARKIIVDIDAAAIDPTKQPVKGDHNIWSDIGAFMESIAPGGLPEAYRFTDWLQHCRNWLTRYDPVKPEHLSGAFHHYGFMRRFSEALPNDAIVVSDTGGNVIMMGHCFRSKKGQRIFSSHGNSAMGFSMCGAMGAWFAQPDRPIICVIGDGGMNMNIQELQTLVNYRIPVKVFILNNHVLGNTKSYQRVNKMAEVACGPDGYKPPDFEKVAHAYGVANTRIDEWTDLGRRIALILSMPGPFVVDVVHHDHCTYEPRVSRWDTGVEEMFPFLPRDEFRANMIVDPLPGWEGIA